ncbi:hypothetical protein AMECASPLE_032926 [Ameca splendens]|uniref:Uncharacterized protein n=1 Tax=Ameca splendens TaxID=208324 RepID=A0ABV1AD35_9TELE
MGHRRLASLETLSSVHLHFTEGSPHACLRHLADWIRTICLQIYLGSGVARGRTSAEGQVTLLGKQGGSY